ncbi:hypothetical protein GOP47_0022404 [Adiantum capillus-veneris]|uniref:dCTP pyrophosphatase 1 n=1 Tax=Adiantum capillus-veneris TaxID=13818 RepID=A0A9D4U5S1_ADICA|nr:hypothetical protein GOP47_0022404 [Adiantum capillus-veneris]
MGEVEQEKSLHVPDRDDGELQHPRHHPHNNNNSSSSDVSLALLTRLMAHFASERDWDKLHSPRNLLLALVGEVGEVSEIFQWKDEVPKGLPDWSVEEKEHLGEELSDVLLYLLRLADICRIDLGDAALKKLKKKALKYPVEKCKGLSHKYTAYKNEELEAREV